MVPRAFDLRSVNGSSVLPPVRNHHLPLGSSCASCWAATTATVLGARLSLSTSTFDAPRRSIEVSAQYLLNCVPGQKRCGYPGSSSNAMAHIETHGIPDESCAPWQNAKFTCDAIHLCASMTSPPTHHANGSTILVPVLNPTLYHIAQNVRIAANDTLAMQRALLAGGPLACGIHAEGLHNYTTGIIMQTTPPQKSSDDHSVAVVGWGEEEMVIEEPAAIDSAGLQQEATTVKYWIVMNNWGTRWGEQGFVRLQRGSNLLGIEGACHYPIVVAPPL